MKGWAVRSWDFIPSGAFVCEYIGVLKKAEDVHDPENMYIMEIDCLETMMGLGQREVFSILKYKEIVSIFGSLQMYRSVCNYCEYMEQKGT